MNKLSLREFADKYGLPYTKVTHRMGYCKRLKSQDLPLAHTKKGEEFKPARHGRVRLGHYVTATRYYSEEDLVSWWNNYEHHRMRPDLVKPGQLIELME